MEETVPLVVAVLVGLSLVAGGATSSLITYRAGAGHLPPNHLAGLRTRATLASPAAWQAAHQAALRVVVVGAAGAVVAGIAVLWVRTPVPFLVLTLGGAAWLVGFVVRGQVVADRTARDLAGSPRPPT